MAQRMFDIAFERMEDGSIRLTQTDCGEEFMVAAHPEQLLFIARQLCGFKPETAAKVAELERRIAVLADRLDELVSEEWLRQQIIERCGDGIEIIWRLDALLELAVEFDGGRLIPRQPIEPQKAPTTSKRGPTDTNPSQIKSNAPEAPQMGLDV